MRAVREKVPIEIKRQRRNGATYIPGYGERSPRARWLIPLEDRCEARTKGLPCRQCLRPAVQGRDGRQVCQQHSDAEEVIWS